jgi:hypothetical protein
MEKHATSGKILSLLHLGLSVLNREKSMIYYSEDIAAKPCRTQRSNAAYLGRVNGIGEGAAAELAFIEYGENRPMLELLDFYRPNDIHRESKPGEDAYSHIGFRTKDIHAGYELAVEKGLFPLCRPMLVDYGYAKGREAFFMKDPNNFYVHIVQDACAPDSDDIVADHDHAVLSVENIEDTIPVFRDLLCCDVAVEDTSKSAYLSAICTRPISKIAVCRSKTENYTLELWETGRTGGAENIYISASGTVHLCYLCRGIDDLYGKFKDKNLRFVNEPVLVTKGVNKDAKAIFFHAPGYLWIELLCRKEDL